MDFGEKTENALYDTHKMVFFGQNPLKTRVFEHLGKSLHVLPSKSYMGHSLCAKSDFILPNRLKLELMESNNTTYTPFER